MKRAHDEVSHFAVSTRKALNVNTDLCYFSRLLISFDLDRGLERNWSELEVSTVVILYDGLNVTFLGCLMAAFLKEFINVTLLA